MVKESGGLVWVRTRLAAHFRKGRKSLLDHLASRLLLICDGWCLDVSQTRMAGDEELASEKELLCSNIGFEMPIAAKLNLQFIYFSLVCMAST